MTIAVKKVNGVLRLATRKLISKQLNEEFFSNPLFNDANLKWYLRLEGNANDAKGLNNGVASNVSYGTSYGKYNQGAHFNATNATIAMTQALTKPFSISFWIKPTLNSAFRRWITNNTGGFDANTFVIRQQPNNNTYWYVNGSEVDGAWLSSGVYSHVVVTISATAGLMYVNGSLVSAATLAMTGSLTANLTIGGHYNSNSEYTDGDMDEILYFDDLLTATEVASIYKSQIKKFIAVSNV